jgi:hypothetical protein
MASRISPAQRGPSWHNPRKVWRARVRWNGIQQFLGYHETREEAERAEDAFRRDIKGVDVAAPSTAQ